MTSLELYIFVRATAKLAKATAALLANLRRLM